MIETKVNILRTKKIKRICENYNVKSFSVFGSFIRDDFKDTSDIDFIVDFNETDPFEYADLYFKFKEELEKMFDHEIDLVEERGIKNSYFKEEVEKTKILLYEKN